MCTCTCGGARSIQRRSDGIIYATPIHMFKLPYAVSVFSNVSTTWQFYIMVFYLEYMNTLLNKRISVQVSARYIYIQICTFSLKVRCCLSSFTHFISFTFNNNMPYGFHSTLSTITWCNKRPFLSECVHQNRLCRTKALLEVFLAMSFCRLRCRKWYANTFFYFYAIILPSTI